MRKMHEKTVQTNTFLAFFKIICFGNRNVDENFHVSAFVNRYCHVDLRAYSLSNVRVFRRTKTDEKNFFQPIRSFFNSNCNTNFGQATFVPVAFKVTNPGQVMCVLQSYLTQAPAFLTSVTF